MNLEKYVENMLNKTSENPQTISFRLPERMINELDEISQEINETRTNLVQRFIKAGIEEFQKQLNSIHSDQLADITDKDKKKYFLLNTNFTNNKNDHLNMLMKQEASAFYNTKHNIERLEEGSTVFLYQSGYGIVAYGVVHGELIVRAHNSKDGEWYAKKLKDFVLLKKPLPAKKSKDITKSNFNFLPTMTQIKKEQGAKLIAYFESDRKNGREFVS